MGRKIVCGVGVGISQNGDEELIFLLQHKSTIFQSEVHAWARKRKVGVRFLVTGTLQYLPTIDG